MSDESIFNLIDISDIPESMQRRLTGYKSFRMTHYICQLFEIKDKLSIDEVMIGLYRHFGHERTRVWVRNILSDMVKNKFLVRSEKIGEYCKIIKKNEIKPLKLKKYQNL